MSNDVELGEAIAIIDEQIDKALAQTRRFRDVWGNGRRESRNGFKTLVQPPQEEIDYDFFRSSQESSIRSNLINPILSSLFNLYGIEASWPKGPIVVWSDNVSYEKVNPIEFVIAAGNERTGYRYTAPDNLTSGDIARLLRGLSIDRLAVIDWSGREAGSLKQSDNELCIGGSELITSITSAEFFDEFFPIGLYEEFVSRIRAAIRLGEEITGYQVVSRLSMPRLASFRTEMLSDVRKIIDGLEDHHDRLVISGRGRTEYRLSKKDRDVLDDAFFREGWGRSLSGTRGFAKCLATSEYLQNAFRQGGEFDYTAIVCGYLKAVEQLANDLMRATLGTPGSESLYIATYKRGRSYPRNHRAFEWQEETPHVQFTLQNERFFSTTLGPLANLLHDNEGAWRISDEGRHFVLLKLRAFADKDRNGYFHKDNFTDYEEVQTIREDAITLLYFLIGGYSIPGDRDRQLKVLGMENVAYDDMFFKLSRIRIQNFILKFEGGEPVKAIRLFKQPAVEYDEYGLVKTNVLFVRVEDHRGHHEWESIETVDKADVFEVGREHIPSEIRYVKRDGTEVRFW